MSVPAWIYLLGFGAMGIAELVALWTKQPGDTLSERTWALLHVRAKGPTPWWAWLLRVVIGGAMAWLTIHLLTGLLST